MPHVALFPVLVALLFLQFSATTHGFHNAGCSHHAIIRTSSRCRTTSRQNAKQIQLCLAPQQLGSFETLGEEEYRANDQGRRNVVLEDLVSESSERVAFNEAWDWQKHVMQEHFTRLNNNQNNFNTEDTTPFLSSEEQLQTWDNEGALPPGGLDTFFILEHEAVYTLVRAFVSRHRVSQLVRSFPSFQEINVDVQTAIIILVWCSN